MQVKIKKDEDPEKIEDQKCQPTTCGDLARSRRGLDEALAEYEMGEVYEYADIGDYLRRIDED